MSIYFQPLSRYAQSVIKSLQLDISLFGIDLSKYESITILTFKKP